MPSLPKKNNDRSRIEDVARRAGVSVATVSRVINKLGTVKAANRLKVEEAVAALNYTPDQTAQRLARGSVNALGLVIPRYEGLFFSFYAMEIIRGVGSACERFGLDLTLIITDGKKNINASTIGGLVFADILGNRHQLEAALTDDVPCVVINNVLKDSSKAHFVAVDNKKGALQATEYLFGLGHRDIAFITGGLSTQSAALRLEGYRQAYEKRKLKVKEELIFKGDFSRRSGREAAQKILDLIPRPTAIFASSDDMAFEAITVMLERGVSVPKDISFVGFDDNPECISGHVSLTTVRQPLLQMSQTAVELLHDVMSGKKTGKHEVVLQPQLVIRDSCRPVQS